MKLGARIFFCYLALMVVCFYYPVDWIVDTLRTRYLEGVEDPLVDQANILAVMVGKGMESGSFDPETFYKVFEAIKKRRLSARIYDLLKEKVDMQVYITDALGKIIFDSSGRDRLGKDFSRWRDVRFTLDGKYGARTTQVIPDDPYSSVLHVAAPVFVHEQLSGVLTIAKPTTTINSFLRQARPKIIKVSLLAGGAAVILGLLISIWITRPINRLTHYADAIRLGKQMPFPRLDGTEIGDMGKAFKKMQEALEGKKYVEHYVQTLTHEIKSPLSAIRGAAELLEEKMAPERRVRFLKNIRNEADRIQDLVDRLLELSALENRRRPYRMEPIHVASMISSVMESKRPLISKKGLHTEIHVPENFTVKGNIFLLHQAVSNIVQNAVDFSPLSGTIRLSAEISPPFLNIMVVDEGPGIPDYAKDRIFEKFFSLQRPDSGKKSTGLGLNLVKEVAALHSGDIRVGNRSGKGSRVTLLLPI
jgi:two-component system sensor histidine kinase CreC